MDPVVDLLEREWQSIVELCQSLRDDEWDAPTDCPGWSVKDNISHLIGIENMLRGAPSDPPIDERPAHVRNDIGAFNEAAIAARRDRTGPDVLAEFQAVAAERLATLRALPDEKWDEIGPTPTGPGPYRHFMRMRAFDSWVHEQDIRRAVARPGHIDGPVVDLVLAWHRRNLGYVVGKRAKAPEGSVVAFDVVDQNGSRVERNVLAVRDGRAVEADEATEVDTELQCDVETYNALLCGRWTASDAQRDGRLRITGDTALGRQIADAMAYVF